MKDGIKIAPPRLPNREISDGGAPGYLAGSASRSMAKIYTYRVQCLFSLQFSFPESEVEPDDDGKLAPTEAALEALAAEVREALEESYPVASVEALAEAEDLLGVIEHESA